MSGPTLRRLFTACQSPSFFVELAPELPVAKTINFSAAGSQSASEIGPALGPDGFTTLPKVIRREHAEAMRAAIEALHAAEMPPLFGYVYDAFWEPLASLRAWAEAQVGGVDVLADIWAFRIPPGARGWSAHRGSYELEGARTMLNAWIALTDADATTSCMFVLPLTRDPSYPHALSNVSLSESDAVPLVTPTGTAAVWDANTLHCGGPMRADATGPRMSLTFTLRSQKHRRADLPVLDVTALTFERRLDLIADEILKYQHKEPLESAVLEWAKLRSLTRCVGSSL